MNGPTDGSPDPLYRPWLVVENARAGGELLTLTAGARKYALVFTEPEGAALFLAGLDDATDLRVASLESFVLKEAYLTAARSVGADAVVFDYRRGGHSALAADLERVSEQVRARIGAIVN